MNINPKKVVEREIIIPTKNTSVQQVGVDLTLKNTVVIKHGKFKNVEIAETFNMQKYFGLLIIRSSFSRQGIFMSSGVFDCGFKGMAGVSLYNLSGHTVKIDAGTRFCQLIVFKANYAKLYKGHYNISDNISSKLNIYVK